ncbi:MULTISPECIES: Tn3 family transposase [unclassified Streptomyces]|uniref:Tn3 family transposase n=1 Tax=unclassified Streptomyces TaxID=2593676 RepID=UPI002DDB9DB4|nr:MULTISPECIES: Tn3 family transposase [unclassified Streptomyces]WSB74349.1 transposase [Streptomyces sp. NBC_01775]WSS17270.1 transposase [Streptomyces sp. NBC_01186]WSS46012.1 transposase [Streptomyces sp. NBC_01187]
MREGAVSSSTLLKRLRSGSHKNSTYTAFRAVGRVIRTVQLLRYLSDAPLRRRVTAATNKVESFNRFSQRVGFGNQGVLADNDPIEQEKAMKFNALLTNAVMFRGVEVDHSGSGVRGAVPSFGRYGIASTSTSRPVP